jgi:CheY-like chemotaxis protein
MNVNQSVHFIIIEDNHFDTRIAQKVVENLDRHLSLTSFTDGHIALAHIESNGAAQPNELTYILLDVYMPQMDGFDFLDAYEKLPETVRGQYRVIMLSSSINFADVARVKDYPTIFATVEKPLSEVKLMAQLR